MNVFMKSVKSFSEENSKMTFTLTWSSPVETITWILGMGLEFLYGHGELYFLDKALLLETIKVLNDIEVRGLKLGRI